MTATMMMTVNKVIPGFSYKGGRNDRGNNLLTDDRLLSKDDVLGQLL